MLWSDVNDIAIGLSDKYPEDDPFTLNFVELRRRVIELDGFEDDPERCGEKILEAIQMAWVSEMD